MVASASSVELPSDLPCLPQEWGYVPLRDLIDDGRGICYGIVQPGSGIIDGVPIVRVNNIRNGRVDTDDVLRVRPEIETKYQRSKLRGGEVLLTLVGSLGESAIASPELAGWNVARAVGVIPVARRVGGRWVELCLRSSLLQHYIRVWATTTVQATFNLRDVARLPIPMPPDSEREAIASILGTLDDKIELNRRTNRTLESIARAIFKSWFVDFDPVRAKSKTSRGGAAGQSPPGLAPHLAALFPDTFETSELGDIPKGWRIGELGEAIGIHDSKRIPLSSRQRKQRHGKYRYYGAAGIVDYVDDYLFDGIYVLVGEDGSVVTDSGNPVVQYVWGQFWVNNHAHVLTGMDGICEEQLYLFMQQVHVVPYVTGAVQPKLSQGNMKAIPFLHPSPRVNAAFRQLMQPLFAKLRANHDENGTLAALRDALLPKLISGELRVPDAERIVGRAL